VTDSRTVDCERHGSQPAAFVCQHVAQSLISRERVGFFWPRDTEEERPDAWCSACNERVAQSDGEWVGSAAEHLGAKLLCGRCYDEARGLNLIPPFDEALSTFRRFLRSQGHPDRVVWAFREDMYYSRQGDQYRVSWPLPHKNEGVARMLFEVGQRRDLVGLHALFYLNDYVVATVEAPEPDEIQGWSENLKLSVRSPLVEAEAIRRFLWPFHRRSLEYRRSQELEWGVPQRPRPSG